MIHRPEHPVFEGTNLRYGDQLGAAAQIVGYEVDGCELTMVNGDPVPDVRRWHARWFRGARHRAGTTDLDHRHRVRGAGSVVGKCRPAR